MKVSKCNAEKKKEVPKSLTWEDIKKEEGVYQTQELSTARFVVVHDRKDGLVSVLYYDGVSIEVAQPSWHSYKFIRTNEEVVFDIR